MMGRSPSQEKPGGKRVPGRENSKCKGPEMEMRKEVRNAGGRCSLLEPQGSDLAQVTQLTVFSTKSWS
jgi:hypothetical protein